MLKEILPFHYLTQDVAFRPHEEQVQLACEAGIKWVQLRMKEKTLEECLVVAHNVKKITDRFQVTLIINDYPFVAKEADADGVHLGQNDMKYEEAREILGAKKIIGLSAHNITELQRALATGADYIGIGPFRFTSTKKNLDAVLGLDGTKDLIAYSNLSGHKKPLIAIGGIKLNDVKPLFEIGIDGIAVSSAINLHENPYEESIRFLMQPEILNYKTQTI